MRIAISHFNVSIVAKTADIIMNADWIMYHQKDVIEY